MSSLLAIPFGPNGDMQRRPDATTAWRDYVPWVATLMFWGIYRTRPKGHQIQYFWLRDRSTGVTYPISWSWLVALPPGVDAAGGILTGVRGALAGATRIDGPRDPDFTGSPHFWGYQWTGTWGARRQGAVYTIYAQQLEPRQGGPVDPGAML